MALSYFDKAIIFLLPLLVLQFFKDQTVYLSIEYIYSITILIIPFLDAGLSGYFYYYYRNEENKRSAITNTARLFHIIYFVLTLIGGIVICFHYFIYPIDEYIVYIVPRAIFAATFSFLASYYRLVNKPQKGLYVTITANVLSLAFLFIYILLDINFSLWLIFIGQILFCVFYFIQIVKNFLKKWNKYYKNLHVAKMLKASLLFSWPSILQAFLMMYIANYGKIHIDNLSIDEGTLLSLTQRFSMLMQITHTAVLAFLIKEIYTTGDMLEINKKPLFKYLVLLSITTIGVFVMIFSYLIFNQYPFQNNYWVILGIVGYTFIWCVNAYFQLYFSRENKNIINLYLAIANGFLFIVILNLKTNNYLETITMAMFFSVLITMIINTIVLYRRKYYLI